MWDKLIGVLVGNTNQDGRYLLEEKTVISILSHLNKEDLGLISRQEYCSMFCEGNEIKVKPTAIDSFALAYSMLLCASQFKCLFMN